MTERDDQSVDEGVGGFFDIFGDSGIAGAEAEAAPEPDVAEPAPRTKQAAAEAPAPEEESDEEDLSAEERVAANFAAIGDELGLTEEVDEPESEEAEGEPDYSDLSKLSREELEALASESMGLKEKSQGLQDAEVMRAVQMAEQQAVAYVQRQFEQEVKAPSVKHYDSEFANRLAKILRNAANSEDFERQVIQAAVPLHRHFFDSETTYQEQQADTWEDRLEQAKMEARKSVPELRQVYARTLLENNGLPISEKAIAAVMKTKSGRERSTDDFQDRVAELVEMRDRYAKLQAQNTTKRREDGKKLLAATAPKTATNVRGKTRKPQPYKGDAEEGIRLLAAIREG